MNLATAFWITMLLYLVLGVLRGGTKRDWTENGLAALPWLAMMLAGWALFGAPLKA